MVIISKQNLSHPTFWTNRQHVKSFLKYAAAIVFGMSIGIVIGRSHSDLQGIYSSTNYKVDPVTVLKKDFIENDGSFHPIHVYRGSPQAINNLPNQMSELTLKYPKGSQVDQDKVIIALIEKYRSKHNKKGSAIQNPNYFIDLAANDALQLSNTLLLENQGWEGLCIEPNPVYWYRLAHRKCTVAGAFVGGISDMQEVTVSFSQEYGGIVGEEFDNSEKKETDEKRYSVSLSTLFSKFHVPKQIQYLSLDVEGAEELIMKDFPFDEYVIDFITIERPRPALKELLESNGYIFVTMLIHWGETLWVHKNIIEDDFSLNDIIKTTKENSRFIDQKPKRGAAVFDLETGEYK